MQLHPFQDAGASFVASKRHAYLADEMGLGKTAQLITAARRAGAKRVLVIAKAILENSWKDEFPEWAPEREPPHLLRDPAKIPKTGDVITSFDRAVSARDELRACKFDALMVDEAEALKTPTAARTRAVLNPVHSGKRSIAQSCGATWLASGTPVPNNPAELWPALKTAGLVEGRFWDFAYKYCRVDETPFGRRIQGAKNVDGLRALLSGYMLRRMLADVEIELPPLNVDTLEIDGHEIDDQNPILPTLRELDAVSYEEIAACIASNDWSMRSVPHIATIRRLTGLAKAFQAVRLAHMELEFLHEKIVLFGIHSDVLGYLAYELREFQPVMLTGAETNKQRGDNIKLFQKNPTHRVAICQMKAAGAGLTLTAANRLVIVESAWTAADNEQAIKRIHRIGQHRECFASFLALRGSSDERVTAAVRSKARTARQILNHGLTI